ncbi:MAG: hypothetical protein JO218_03210 [Burkholderiales bacterium]|nr:hypothetical protein [Burkholderiales bacterium]
MRSLYLPVLMAALLAAPVMAFDLGSALDSVNKALDTAKNAKSAADGVSGSASGSVSGNGGASGGATGYGTAPKPHISQTAATPFAPEIQAEPSNMKRVFKEVEEHTFFLSHPSQDADDVIHANKMKTLRGAYYHDQYDHPHSQSTLQVWESYQKQFANEGYTVDYKCEKPCLESSGLWSDAENVNVYSKSDRYIVAHKGDIWVSVLIGEMSDHPVSVVSAIEVKG